MPNTDQGVLAKSAILPVAVQFDDCLTTFMIRLFMRDTS
nr:MAG TPA: hypothetical protein [Caudoviricetes sp.]